MTCYTETENVVKVLKQFKSVSLMENKYIIATYYWV